MRFLNKTISFLAVFSVLPAAFALTARPSVITTAASRGSMPTMTRYLTTSSGTTTSTVQATSSLLENTDCINAYTECIKGDDACGTDFGECTTKVLFHAKMPQCLSTLAQCSATGISSLFGTSATTALSNVATTNSYGEITDYTYPTDGSVLGQMIAAGAISNKYDTPTCIRRYTSCLKKDDVCGSDFELCTTDKEFKKQRVLCDSTLARCPGEGIKELFGTTSTTATPSSSSRIGEMIKEGGALAAVNAVSTCYKVIDQCIMSACSKNPYKCYDKSTQYLVDLAENIANPDIDIAAIADTLADFGKQNVSAYIKASCQDTIGSNKYCYATFNDGKMPTASELRDSDNQSDVYSAAYSARMNASMIAKITDLVEKFDTKAKSKCTDTIKSCAMRVCGGGVGAACYSEVFGSTMVKSINNSATHETIKTGCAAIVNTDANCKYAAANRASAGTYSYAYIDNDAFDALFPVYEEGGDDPIGVVAALNASLANNYSDAAVAQMKKQCQSVAKSCVKSMCGSDYENCYRNRTDIYSDLTKTDNETFDKSMNKVGGVLDYTVVLGLCLDTVKNASVCEEHLAIEANKLRMSNSTGGSWGDKTNVRDGWIDAGGATKLAVSDGIRATDDNGNELCTISGTADEGVCYTTNADGRVYDQPIYIAKETYIQSQAASTLFKDLIYDLEKEAQAKYNAKLTREQSICSAQNSGGIIAKADTGSTYMWVKLKSTKVPTDYAVAGLKPSQFVPSNDLYGSFCRARVTLHSDDKHIQEVLKDKDWAMAYFAVGDTFTCGSWIPEDDLVDIANKVKGDATKNMEAEQKRTRGWLTALGTVGTAVGGVALGEGIRKGNVLGSLTGIKTTDSDVTKNKNNCVNYADGYISARTKNSGTAVSYSSYLKTAAGALKLDTYVFEEASKDAKEKQDEYDKANTDTTKQAAAAAAAAADSANAAARVLKQQCKDIDSKTFNESDGKDKNRKWITGVSTAVTSAAGGAITYFAVKDIQDKKLTEEQQKAYDAWMDNIGKHITCYIGGEEAGSYGDIIGISMDN